MTIADLYWKRQAQDKVLELIGMMDEPGGKEILQDFVQENGIDLVPYMIQLAPTADQGTILFLLSISNLGLDKIAIEVKDYRKGAYYRFFPPVMVANSEFIIDEENEPEEVETEYLYVGVSNYGDTQAFISDGEEVTSWLDVANDDDLSPEELIAEFYGYHTLSREV